MTIEDEEKLAMIAVDSSIHEIIKDLATQKGITIQDLVAEMVTLYTGGLGDIDSEPTTTNQTNTDMTAEDNIVFGDWN